MAYVGADTVAMAKLYQKIGSELIMWYVIQTVNGQEQQVCTWINQRMDQTLFERCFVPLYEDVWRKEGVGHISVRKTFVGYVFIKTDRPDEVYEELRKIPKLAIMLSDQMDQNNQKEKTFIPVSAEEEQFLRSIYMDGIMRVSYIEKNSNGRVTAIIGSLEQYQDYIIKLDLSHRRAVAEIPLFGQMRRMKFGLWCEKDAQIPWIEEEKRLRKNHIEKECRVKGNSVVSATGLQPGDYVINTRGICGDQTLKVTGIDERKRTIDVEMELFGELLSVQMSVDDVEKVEEKITDEGSTVS